MIAILIGVATAAVIGAIALWCADADDKGRAREALELARCAQTHQDEQEARCASE